MLLSLPEVVKVFKYAKLAILAPEDPDKKLSEQEVLGSFLIVLGRLASQGRINEQEYQFVVNEVSKKGITEEEIKILNFVIQTLNAPAQTASQP